MAVENSFLPRLVCLAAATVLAGLCTCARGAAIELRLEEPLRRSWQNEVVHMEARLPRDEFRPETFRLLDEQGRPVTFQVSDVFTHQERPYVEFNVWVRADLEPFQVRTFALHYGEPAAEGVPATDLAVVRDGDCYILSNSRVGVRALAGARTYSSRVPPSEAPAPLQAVRGPNGTWIGKGWLEGPQKVLSYEAKLVDDGPIFKQVAVTYAFEGGRYTMWVKLTSECNVVMVREEFDLGPPSEARNQNFVFSLYPGLRPDTVRWRGRVWDKTLAVNNPAFGYQKMQEAWFPIDYSRARPLVHILGLFVWWPETAHYFAAYRKNDPQGDLVAIFRARPSYWRNPTAMFLSVTTAPDLQMRTPLRQPVQEWAVDGVDYGSPYYTGVVAPGTPRSYGRRQWGILLSTTEQAVPPDDDVTRSGINRAMVKYGENPLDKILGWTLKWPDPGPQAYPRAWIRREELPALRAKVKAHEEFSGRLGRSTQKPFTYLVNQDPELGKRLWYDEAGGDANWMGILPRLRWVADRYLKEEGDLGIHTMMHHGIGTASGHAAMFDAAMSVPGIPEEDRREARALHAFCTYKLCDPDWLAKESGFHLGNPNMPTAAENSLGFMAALIPNHPEATIWALRTSDHMARMLSDYTAPGGAWLECPHYQMDAAMKAILEAGLPLRNSGFMDIFQNPDLKATMLYVTQILTPVDPRFRVRTIPALGNGSHETSNLFGRMAQGARPHDPEYASWMQWAWKAVGSPITARNDPMVLDPDIPSSPPDMSSRHFPGFGAVFRSHFGDPDETYVIFRMGYQHAHYEIDQGNIILYSKGAPLCLDFGSIYQPTMLRPWLHNRISIDHKVEDFTQVGEITEHEFLPSADAALGSVSISRLFEDDEYPGRPKPPNVSPPPEVIPPTVWTRQVMLVKDPGDASGPHYVLIRDSFGGQPTRPTDWTLWCLADDLKTDGPRALYTGQYGVDLDVHIIKPESPTFQTGQYGHEKLFYNHIGARYMPGGKFKEYQKFIRIKQPPAKGYFAVLCPRKRGEQGPAFKSWAAGAGVSARIGGARHFAIMAEGPGTYAEGDVVLEGQRAVVRRKGNDVALTLLRGTSLKCGPVAISGDAPCELTLIGGKAHIASSLPRAGAVKLQLPSGIRLGRGTPEGDLWRVELPAGKFSADLN